MKRVAFVAGGCLMLLVAGGGSVYANCPNPTAIGYAFDSYLLCDDRGPVWADVFEVLAPDTGNSGPLRVDCTDANSKTDPNNPNISCASAASGVPGQITFETDAFLSVWNGCPAPPGQLSKRIVGVVVDASGRGVAISVSGRDPGLGFAFEAAHQTPDGVNITPLSCGNAGRPKITGVTTAGTTQTIRGAVIRPVLYTDCDPGTLGALFGTTCPDNFFGATALGPNLHLYTRIATCPSGFLPHLQNLQTGGWTAETVTPSPTDGSFTLVKQASTDPTMCLYVASAGNFGGGPDALLGFIAVPPPGAASARAEQVRAAKAQGKVDISWVSRSEIGLAAYKILTDAKSKGLLELTTVAPKGGGGAASYSLSLGMDAFKGGRSVIVRSVMDDGTVLDAAPVNF